MSGVKLGCDNSRGGVDKRLYNGELRLALATPPQSHAKVRSGDYVYSELFQRKKILRDQSD